LGENGKLEAVNRRRIDNTIGKWC